VGRKELESLVLDPWASRRREDLLKLLDQLDPWIDNLDEAVIQAADGCPQAVCLMRQAGVGPVTALAFVLTIGPVSRFANSKKGSELSRAESKRRQLGGSATAGCHQ
jgi:transposase